MNEEMRTEKRIKKKGRIIFPLFVMLFCLVLGFFSLPDMNKGIRTASFRRSLLRTKGPAV